ncbi:MAG: transketolase [bacterium]
MSTKPGHDIDSLCINAIRMLAVDQVEAAKSGHPGMPLGAAPMAYLLWTKFLRHSPQNPAWPDRDRFILSAGHGSALLYALLHLTGYDLPLEELKRFRQWGSMTPGHPERGCAPGVEVTTGPLGQGIGMAVGMAMAERFLAVRHNRPGLDVVDHNIYAIVSDGDLMEGIASEAASFAGHQKLGKLVCLYDDNHISIDGSTELAFSEDACVRFEAYGWQVQRVKDGNDLLSIERAIERARDDLERPSFIAIRTHIGFGSPKQDNASVHGEPLGAEAIKATRAFFGWPADQPFFVPPDALAHLRKTVERGRELESAWQGKIKAFRANHPDDAQRFERELAGDLPDGWESAIPAFELGKSLATREASGKVINALAKVLPNLLSGSADLTPSVKTYIDDGGDAEALSPAGRNIHFGVREHAMGAAINGMALHGGVIPFGGTFLIFSDYMRPSIRIASLERAHSIFVFTHDSIGLGEDGPTHQPIEHLMSLRAIPGLKVLRPADGNETAAAWRLAISLKGPVALVLTRQKLPVLDETGIKAREGVARGAYVLSDSKGAPDAILIATGSEVHLAVEARRMLASAGVDARVVSMPCWELFAKQPQKYRDEVLPPNVRARVAVEAGATLGWYRWVGDRGRIIGIDRFGASAPAEVLMKELGFTAEHIVQAAKETIENEQ